MNDRSLGFIVAAIIAAPICVLCIAGPALIAVVAGSVAAWFTGAKALVFVGLLAGLAALAWRVYTRRRALRDETTNALMTRQT